MIGTIPIPLLALAAVAAGLFAYLLLAPLARSDVDKRRANRIAALQARRFGVSKASATGAPSLLLTTSDSSFAGFDRIIKQFMPHPALLRERLAKTGRSISIGEYALACLAIGAIATLIRTQIFALPPILSILSGIVVGFGVPHFVVNRMIQNRTKKFNAQFPDAIDLILRGLKAGLPVSESLRVVAQEFDDPIGTEFARVNDAVAIGKPLDQALWDAAKRLDTPEFRFFIVSLAVQAETGGNLSATLENLAEVLRKRHQMHLKIKAMSSEAKASAMIIGSLPFVMFFLLYLVNEPYVMSLFGDPRGMLMVGAGLSSLSLGVFVMMKMVRFEI
ncbi:MAG: type II secretion system F family protein [Alphaproteobacteria bacterium]